jgi:hypothetical protein
MSKVTVYRHDFRDFKDGDTMPPAGDHYDRLTPDQKLAEDAIRAGKLDGTQIRAESLYVYSDPKMAEVDWKFKKGRHLYKLEVDEATIRHWGDLQVFNDVKNAVRKNASLDELVEKYWTPVEAGRYTELLVSDATVVERLKHASEYQSASQRINAKMRDDPENLEFFERMFPQPKKD